MTWNYRIVRYKSGDAYGLHEVYYNKSGEACGMTENCATFGCDAEEGPDGITASLELALKDARTRPVFDEPEVWAKWDDGDEDA